MTEQKRCLNCNMLMVRKKLRSGFVETPSVFAKRKFCSHTCGAINSAAVKRAALDARSA